MKKFKYIYIILFTIVCYSCNDSFFEQNRPQEPLASDTRTFERVVMEAYIQTFWAGRSGIDLSYDLLVSNALQCAGPNAGFNMDNQFRRLYDGVEVEGQWKTMYRAIFWCNYGLDLHKKNNNNLFNLDVNGDDYKKNYIRQVGELYFLRAYAYFSLMRWYAPPYNETNKDLPGVVLATEPSITQEAVNNLKLASVEQIYNQIISDFKNAIDLLPEKLENYDWNNYDYFQCGRANKFVAKTLLGRLYFMMGDNEKALPLINDVISSPDYYLSNDVTEPFTNVDRTKRIPENIWEFNSGRSDNGSSDRNNAWSVFYTVQCFGYRLPLCIYGGGNDLVNPDGSPLISLNLSNGINPHYVSYYYLRLMEWMEADKGNTYIRDANVESEVQLRTISKDTLTTNLALKDERYRRLFHATKGLKKGLIPPKRANSFPAEKEFNEQYPDEESWNKGYFECLEYDPDVNTDRKPYTENSKCVYIDKYYRGNANMPFASNFTLFPLYRLAELYIIRAQIKFDAGDKKGAAEDLNITWNRAHKDSNDKDRYDEGNITADDIFAEYLREMMGDGHILDFMYATKRTIPKGDNRYPSVIDEPYPYSNIRFSFPVDEFNINKNIDKDLIY